jgi:predicted nucleic-acid-binding protein
MKGVDTNVLVRYLTRDDVAQERVAMRFLGAARERGEPTLVNVIVLCELVWVLRAVYEYSKPDVAAAVERILSTEQLLVEDADLAWLALGDYRAGAGDFADDLIGRRNLHLGCEATATFDGRLKAAGFQVLTPVRR